jgi:hypothetical protein
LNTDLQPRLAAYTVIVGPPSVAELAVRFAPADVAESRFERRQARF